MPGRLLADVNALGMDILRAALASFGTTVTVVEELPPDWTKHYPLVVGHRLPGGGAIDLRFLDNALYQIDVYDGDPTRAADLAEWCRTALYEALGLPFGHGSLTEVGEQSGPAVVRRAGAPVGETFIPATYRLTVCP